MDMKLQLVLDGKVYDLDGIKWMSVDTDKTRDLVIESDEKGVGMTSISLTIRKDPENES